MPFKNCFFIERLALCLMLMSIWRDIDHSSQLQNTEQRSRCCQSLRNDESQTQLERFIYPLILLGARQSERTPGEKTLTPCFHLLGLSMSLGFSASAVISHCHSSFASFLLRRRKECVMGHKLKMPYEKLPNPGNEKQITVYSQTNHPHQSINVDMRPSAELSRSQSKAREGEKKKIEQCADFTLSSP